MEQSQLLRYVVDQLERLQLPYLVTGSIAAAFFGEPRFTNDIDVVVRLSLERVPELCGIFPANEFYVSLEAAARAVRTHGQFNIIHPASGLKVDIMIPEPTAFNQSRFARATRLRPEADYEAAFASPEDVILKKMDYYREGGSEKHLRDIAGILKISRGRIDLDYIRNWADRLGLIDVWSAVQQRAS